MDMMKRVIETTRAFEKKHFGVKEEEESLDYSRLTTKQKAVVEVLLKEDFGCNQGKVRRLMAAVMGIDEGLMEKPPEDSGRKIPFEKFLAFVDEEGELFVNMGVTDLDGDYCIIPLDMEECDEDCCSFFRTNWRTATNEEIEAFFSELMR